MQNPCNECLVKIVCSELCPDKMNYKTLLQNALDNLQFQLNSRLSKQYSYYKNLHKENTQDLIKITSTSRLVFKYAA